MTSSLNLAHVIISIVSVFSTPVPRTHFQVCYSGLSSNLAALFRSIDFLIQQEFQKQYNFNASCIFEDVINVSTSPRVVRIFLNAKAGSPAHIVDSGVQRCLLETVSEGFEALLDFLCARPPQLQVFLIAAHRRHHLTTSGYTALALSTSSFAPVAVKRLSWVQLR